MIAITVNGTPHQLDVENEMPLLWVLRDELGLTGTKFGCGIAACGACTVHVDGKPVRSCSVPIGSVAGAQVTTIEGLSPDSKHPVQQAWLAEEVPQCGYCQSGQIMAVAAYIKANPKQWAFLKSLPRERLERAVVWEKIRNNEQRHKLDNGLLRKIEQNPALKKDYEALLKHIPEDQQERAKVAIARTLVLSQSRGQRQTAGVGV